MALSKTGICDFGWEAGDFKLKGVDGQIYTLADVRGPNGTLVVFICNHCPYVKASISRIVAPSSRNHSMTGTRSFRGTMPIPAIRPRLLKLQAKSFSPM